VSFEQPLSGVDEEIDFAGFLGRWLEREVCSAFWGGACAWKLSADEGQPSIKATSIAEWKQALKNL
jgi:hypothetical protein